MKLSLTRRFFRPQWRRMLAGNLIRFRRSFLGHQEMNLSASKILHLPRLSKCRRLTAVAVRREVGREAVVVGAPEIQVSETSTRRREELRRFGASSRQFLGRETRKRLLRRRRRVQHCAGKARGCYRILESCYRRKCDDYGGVGGSKRK